jgi:anti-anti-sigma factor
MSMQFTVQTVEGGSLVHLEGSIDREAEAALDAAWEDARRAAPGPITLDFSAVDYINSTGIALIVGLLSQARDAEIALRAVGLTEHYRHIFDITRLSDYIEIA